MIAPNNSDYESFNAGEDPKTCKRASEKLKEDAEERMRMIALNNSDYDSSNIGGDPKICNRASEKHKLKGREDDGFE
ncbi:hypothetical protein SUGI_0444040 [Cryptomeria japonica]|nr:hypothetical protein SUGI_0444040 [Cryptomeria japonica]